MQQTRLPVSSVYQSIGLAEAFGAWLETDSGRSYKDVALFRLIAAIADPTANINVNGLAPAMAARLSAGVAYLRQVAIGDICPVDNAVAGAIAHAAFAIKAPELLTDERQVNVWGKAALCDEDTFVKAMKAFGNHEFVAGEVTQVGGTILYAATSRGGSAQSKMLATIGAAAATDSLDAKLLGEYVAKLTQEGSAFNSIGTTGYSTARQGAQTARRQQQQTQAQATA